MRSTILSAAALALLLSACSAAGTNQSIPSANANAIVAPPDAVSTSVLKTLTKQTTIGSTVDASNGDQAPYGITYISMPPYGGGKLKKGDLVVCNYADKTGVFGKGTTEEYLVPKAGAKPAQLLESTKIAGCNALGTDPIYGDVYSSDATAKNAVETTAKGKAYLTIANANLVQPFGGAFGDVGADYPPGNGYWVGDATSGVLNRIDLGTSGGKPPVTSVVTGFKVNKGRPGSVLGPTAVLFTPGPGKRGIAYVVDGASNIIYAFANAYYDLDQADAIKIGANGTTFTGPAAKDAKVLLSGKPLASPIAATVLPDGNLVVANSDNTLVEIETTGQVLDTKQVDGGAANAIHGIVAVGSAGNTVLYFNDLNGNNVQELSK
jgi:hypothetical protein